MHWLKQSHIKSQATGPKAYEWQKLQFTEWAREVGSKSHSVPINSVLKTQLYMLEKEEDGKKELKLHMFKVYPLSLR